MMSIDLLMYALLALLIGTVLADPLLWGPYRANLYFGMRPKIPHSLMTGLMWFNNNNFAGIQNLRHDALSHEDTTYTWTQYDTRIGGTQHIFDVTHNLNLTIDLSKSEDGTAWVARIRGDQPKDGISTMIWYNAIEGNGNLDLVSKLSPKGIAEPLFKGSSSELGRFSLQVSEPSDNKAPKSDHVAAVDMDTDLWHYTTLNIPSDNVWKAKDVYLTLLQDHVNKIGDKFDPETVPLATFPSWSALTLNNEDTLKGNMHYIQKTFEGPFEFSLTFNDHKPDWDARNAALDEKFANVSSDPKYSQFAKELISNLVAGVGYFYGDSLIAEPDTPEMIETAPAKSLYTCTPSRGFFPRGFYWDEGFHLMGLLGQDLDQVIEILESWFGLMDESGWIGREQILGPESRERVPKEFQVQVSSVANPPTIITFLAHLGTIDDPKVKQRLETLFPLLEEHFAWFRSTQKGKVLAYDREAHSYAEAYRWRGRTKTHVLASGLDDYPRSDFMGEGELNVDLLSWIGAMAESLTRIATTIGNDKKAAHYLKIVDDIKENLVDLHWSDKDAAFCDVAVDDFEEDIHECHIGYVTHLPFFLRLVKTDDDSKLLAVLEDIRDEEQLWSKGGLRSLSKSDKFFGTGENYWRGAVWINMNYLALDALQYYFENSSPQVADKCAEIYKELRENIIENVYEQWAATGTAWEQYDAITGEKRGVQQFTGWTSLVANIISWPEELVVPIVPEEVVEEVETIEQDSDLTESAEQQPVEPEEAIVEQAHEDAHQDL